MSGKYTPPGIDVKQAGAVVKRGAQTVNFASGATVTDAGGVQADVAVAGGGAGALTVKYLGSTVDAASTELDFAGTGVYVVNTATGVDSVTIPGALPPDVLANRPAAASANRGGVFYATDTGALYISDGSAWTKVTLTITEAQVTNLTTDLAAKVATTRQVIAGTGLSGGGALSADVTLSLPNVGSAGTTGDPTHVAQVTTDAQGRVSGATAVAISGAGIDTSALHTGVAAGGDLAGTLPNPTVPELIERQIGSLTMAGHSYIAGTTQTDSGVANVYQESLVAKLQGLLGIHEHNTLHLGQSGSLLVGGLGAISGSPFGGWPGVFQFVVPNNSINVNAATDVTVLDPPIASVGAGLIVHGINDANKSYATSPTAQPALAQAGWKHALRACISRMRAGVLFCSANDGGSLSWDAAITFTGTWSDQASTTQNTGPAYKQTVTSGDSFTFLIPANFTGGTIAVNLLQQGGGLTTLTSGAMNNTDVTTAVTVASGADFPVGTGTIIQIDSEQMLLSTYTSATSWTLTRGFNGTSKAAHSANAPVFVASNTYGVTWSTTGSNASITGTDHLGWNGVNAFALPFTKRFVCTAADAGRTITGTFGGFVASDTQSKFWFDSVQIESALPPPIVVTYIQHYQMNSTTLQFTTNNVPASWNAATDAVIAEFDGYVKAADVYTPFFNRNGSIGAPLNNTDVTSSIAWTCNSSLFTPTVGMEFGFGPSTPERVIVTAVSGSAPNFTLTITRGTGGTSKTAHLATAFMGPTQWMSTIDQLHLSNMGHAVFAKTIYDTFKSIVATTGFQPYQAAVFAGNWSEGAQAFFPGTPDSAWQTPLVNGFGTSTAIPTGKEVAFPIYIPRISILTGAGVVTTVAGTGVVRFGIYLPDFSHGRPGRLLQDLGTASNATGGQPAICAVTGRYQILRPGWYWITAVQQTNAATLRTIAAGGMSYPVIPQASIPTATSTLGIAYSHTGITGVLADWGATFTVETSGTGSPMVWYQLRQIQQA